MLLGAAGGMTPTGSTAGPFRGGPLGVCAHADSASTHTARSTCFVLRLASVRITSVGKFLTLSRRANFPGFASQGFEEQTLLYLGRLI